MKIAGKQYYLWRAVDQDGEVVDVFLQRALCCVGEVPDLGYFWRVKVCLTTPLYVLISRL